MTASPGLVRLETWLLRCVSPAAGITNVQIQIADLGGSILGRASGRTTWLDDDAVGSGVGWFVDRTPRNDSEFVRRSNPDEQNRMDLLTVLTHEVGHRVGYEHSAGGVMQETWAAGMRRAVV